ncbi:hypothetical protein GCM10028773_13160 [Spirosoma koreense]
MNLRFRRVNTALSRTNLANNFGEKVPVHNQRCVRKEAGYESCVYNKKAKRDTLLAF